MTYNDLTVGTKIGKLTIISETKGGTLTCECECGREVERTKYGLITNTHNLNSCVFCHEDDYELSTNWEFWGK